MSLPSCDHAAAGARCRLTCHSGGATTIAGCCPCRCPCGSGFSRSHKCPAGRLTLLRPRAVMRAPIRGKATMSDLQARFEQAKQGVQGLSERPDTDTLLHLYALYKQGSEGDVSSPKPGVLVCLATTKYEAWAKLTRPGKPEASEPYVSQVKQLWSCPAYQRRTQKT